MAEYYIANRRFDRTSPGWDAYAKWRGLSQLIEVVSIENYSVLQGRRLTPEEWSNVAPAAEVGPHPVCFRNLDLLQGCLARTVPEVPFNLLCVFREPAEPPVARLSPFTLLGYDLIEDRTGVSALTNCSSGFPAVIVAAEISEFGLIRTFERAKEVQRDLPRAYPQEPHAYCSLWAIFRTSE
jgi:hypothetical protein